MQQEKVQKGCDRVERIGQNYIKGPRIGSEHSLQQSQGGCQFSFPGPLGLEIQEQADRGTARRRSAKKQQRHIPVVELRLSTGSAALETSGTTATIAGTGLVAIEHRHPQTVEIRQSLVSFQAIVNVMNPLPQGIGIHASDNASQTVGAAERVTQPGLPELRCPGHLQSVQAPEPGPIHGENCFYDQRGGDPGERAMIRHAIDHLAGEGEDLFRITDQASENGLTPFSPSSASIPNQRVLQSTVPSLGGS